MKKNVTGKNLIGLYIIMLLLVCACTFDYGEAESHERQTPDLVMGNVIYVRVRSADPIARFQAERAERYEKQGVMKLQNFTFEQYGERGEEVNAFGKAGFASVDIESGDVFMDGGVRLEVESEDIVLEAVQLEWLDDPRILSTNSETQVTVFQENGTNFTGTGLKAYARLRTWEFTGSVGGIFISDDEEDEEDGEDKKEKTEESKEQDEDKKEEKDDDEKDEYDYEEDDDDDEETETEIDDEIK